MSSTKATERPPAPVLKPTKTRRRPALIGLGIALVAVGALAMVYITSTLGQTRTVLAVTTSIARGETIEAKDLVAVDLPQGPTALQAVSSTALEDVVGQKAAVELLPGSLLTPTSYVPVLEPPADSSIVGVAFSSTQMPTTALHAGDHIRVVETPATGGTLSNDPMSIPATVISTHETALGDQKIVNVEVDHKNAATLAALAASGRVALVIDPLEG